MPAQTLFGIGVKLAAVGIGEIDESDYEGAIAAASADVLEATGIDLVAQVEEAEGITGEPL